MAVSNIQAAASFWQEARARRRYAKKLHLGVTGRRKILHSSLGGSLICQPEFGN